MKNLSRRYATLASTVAAATLCSIEAFAPSKIPVIPKPVGNITPTLYNAGLKRSTSLLFMSTETLPEISSMRVGELKKELVSYGISTKSFFEKSELVDAVEKARAEGKTPISSGSDNKTSSSSKDSSSSSSSKDSSKSRDDRLKEETEKCQSMKAGELKKELESYGISTSTFFEKSEFVKACAEARVDGKSQSSGSSSSEEGYAEYADVEVLTSEDAGPRKKAKDQDQQQGGNNPFGGGMPGGMGGMGGMPGGMGGMGGMADILKNMGMGGMGGGGSPFGGGAGGNPFGGGAGGSPFGSGGMPGGGADPMKKAQEMMSNPKVMEIMAKAQSNPKIMKAMQECMSNPAAYAKYQNDPEVGEVMRELQKYM